MTGDANTDVFKAGRTAVITGAASGIGRATSLKLASLGMKVCLVDLPGNALDRAAADVAKADGAANVRAQGADISKPGVMDEIALGLKGGFEDVAFLFNNAVIREKAGTWDGIDTWRHMLEVNFLSVIAGVQAFAPQMIASGRAAMIVNAGSKQGITSPPGNSPYNVTKSAVKTYTELLQHDLRNTDDGVVSAHLLIPGMTTTGGREHSPSAWWPDQVVDYMMAALARGDFYILCPDGEVTAEMDRKRILWAAGDIVETARPCHAGTQIGRILSKQRRTRKPRARSSEIFMRHDMDRPPSIPYVPTAPTHAGVAELVDARDSKSRFLGSVGSSPTTRTIVRSAVTAQ
jgi:NAD(P)-dependent dehydrogenase (short-subunit alcohol dehydrogenase family)